ncbi:hypothetical protein CPB86DRAFT_771694 [Serendipita vermifera]|nr:hypothetical protein CPB86DRAFT_771694 [Serendipita vermifera]
MVSFTTTTALFVVSALSATVNAQSAPNCVYASWASNGDNQNPCQVWQALGQKCAPSFTVTALEPGTSSNNFTSGFYPAPTGSGADNCQCSHIAYSLMAACSWCQEGVYSIDGWLDEASWKAGCNNYGSDGLSGVDTSGLNIPPYATQPIPGPVWDPTDAQAAQVRLGSNGNANGSTGNGNSNGNGSSNDALSTRAIGVVSTLFAVAPITYLLL